MTSVAEVPTPSAPECTEAGTGSDPTSGATGRGVRRSRGATRRAAAGSPCPRRRPHRLGPAPRASRGSGQSVGSRVLRALEDGEQGCGVGVGDRAPRLLRAPPSGLCPPPGAPRPLGQVAGAHSASVTSVGPAASKAANRSAMPRNSWERMTPELPRPMRSRGDRLHTRPCPSPHPRTRARWPRRPR